MAVLLLGMMWQRICCHAVSTPDHGARASAAAAQEASPSGMFRPGADPMHIRASDFIGMRVSASEAQIAAGGYDGTQQGWDDIGEINDVIVSRDGVIPHF